VLARSLILVGFVLPTLPDGAFRATPAAWWVTPKSPTGIRKLKSSRTPSPAAWSRFPMAGTFIRLKTHERRPAFSSLPEQEESP
jgi:hypothetical protein